MTTSHQYLDSINHEYLAVHRTKEDLFWTTYMGTSDAHDESAKAEIQWVDFISNPKYLLDIRKHLAECEQQPSSEENDKVKVGLTGWLELFEANVLETESAKQMKAALIDSEAELFKKRQAYVMTYIDEQGNTQEATTPVLSANIVGSLVETVRKSSHQSLLDLEQWVLSNGFIELVKQRNEFAKILGFANFFDYSVTKTEHMSSEELFVILDDFEQRTRDRNKQSISELAQEKGSDAILAHNFRASWSGDSTREMDPYLSFTQSLSQWVESFSRLRVDYLEAELDLDLLNRKGKYANGFCHAPVPGFYDNDKWIPAKVNFTSLAEPGQVGSGYQGLGTLFHEGGHAAHFSNVTMNAPCFSQEFAPSSMAFAETQSMFLDSLIDDGDWLTLYAKNAEGDAIPEALIENNIRKGQPFKAQSERGILAVPYFERALYQLDDADLTAEKITALAREIEFKILGLAVGPRPMLSIPHLLSDESACSYQGYLLANMAVYQTRAYFINKYGYITDNPEVGPLLAKHYWNPGNSISHDTSIRSLTGEGFNAKYLADDCNLSSEEVWRREQTSIATVKARTRPDIVPLNAHIRIVDGDELIASNEVSDKVMCDDFAQYVGERIEQCKFTNHDSV